MIDEMVANLKTEQADDDNKKDYCGKQLDSADDKKKELASYMQIQEFMNQPAVKKVF